MPKPLRLPRAAIAHVDNAVMANTVAMKKARKLLEKSDPETVVLASLIVAEMSTALLELEQARIKAYKLGGEEDEKGEEDE